MELRCHKGKELLARRELGKADANACRPAGIGGLGFACACAAALSEIDNLCNTGGYIDAAGLACPDSSLSDLVFERQKLGFVKVDPQLFGKKGANTVDQRSRTRDAEDFVEVVKASHPGCDVDGVA